MKKIRLEYIRSAQTCLNHSTPYILTSMENIAFISLTGSHDKVLELGLVILMNNKIDLTRIYYGKVGQRLRRLNFIFNKLRVPSIRRSDQNEIRRSVKHHLLSYNIQTVYTNRSETKYFVQNLLLLPHVSVVLHDEPVPQEKEQNPAYEITRLLQGGIATIDDTRCRYHDGEPLLEDPHVKKFGPECAFYLTIACLMDFVIRNSAA